MPSRTPRILAAATSLAAVLALACGDRDDAAADTAGAARTTETDACGGPAGTTISAAGIGPVRVGQRVSEIPAACTVRDTTFTLAEGMPETGSVVVVDGAPVLALTTGSAEGVISRVIVEDSTFRTERGVGVGSTVADVRRAHGRICALEGEGSTVIQSAQMPGVSYAITWSPAEAPDQLLTEVFGGAEPSTVIDTSHVTRVWVYEGRSACGGS